MEGAPKEGDEARVENTEAEATIEEIQKGLDELLEEGKSLEEDSQLTHDRIVSFNVKVAVHSRALQRAILTLGKKMIGM